MGSLEKIDASKVCIPFIYQGPLEPRPWERFLRYLRETLNTDVAAITLRPGNACLAPLVIWDRLSPLTNTQVRQAEVDHARLVDEDPLSNALRQSGDIFTLDEVIDREALVGGEFYRCLMQPYGIEHQVGMFFEEPGGWACTIGLMRGAGPAFGEAEKEALLDLRPHLEQALTLYARLRHSETERSIFEETLNRLGVGVILLDRNNRVIDSNATAQSILKQHGSLSVVNNRLFAKHDKAVMDAAIAAAQRASDQRPVHRFVEAVRVTPAGGSELGLLIRSVDTQLYQSQASPRVIIYVSNPQQDNIAPEQLIERLFGLTHTEAIVALLLCNGFTLAQTATKLDVAENTARVYSKRIFSKMGVARQADLVRVILKSVALLA